MQHVLKVTDFPLWLSDYCVIIFNGFCLMKAARQKIKEEFRKNMHETSGENIQKV